ncbi:splicing factor U2AF 50 kDa subunit-like isoform X1 [Drosophila kikkawai]|uniref:Splicing factor U2AF 50 kDa subunit-like isoform X1 n=1 Tax=Drosophila kikkawai TaxID=30033 RepID=A0A6P4IX60_DROKI|nr:splicing factor U2AF 50 kDa subunit-like [Drosophila kikkawai]
MKEKSSRRNSLTDHFSVLPYYLNSTRKPFRDEPPPVLEHFNLTEVNTIQVPGPIAFSFLPDMPQVAGPWDTPPPKLNLINLPNTMQVPGQISSSVLQDEHRRLYVGNIPPNITKNMLLQFFNHQMRILNLGPILECQLFTAKRFAFLEFSSVDDTTQAMALNGINLMGKYLKIRRPDKYQRPVVIQSYTSTYVDAKSPNTIYIGALPSFISDDQVKELLLPFGKLRAFKHVKDLQTGKSKGFAFCEYEDVGVTDQVVDALNWLQLCDRKLIVQRASLGAKKAQKAAHPSLSSTEVLCLVNVVTLDELRQEKSVDILKGIREECEKFGVVRSVEMPRPIEGEDVPGCGNVFVLFDSALDCQKAKEELCKRNFNGRAVITSYFDPEKYNRREF